MPSIATLCCFAYAGLLFIIYLILKMLIILNPGSEIQPASKPENQCQKRFSDLFDLDIELLNSEGWLNWTARLFLLQIILQEN